MQVTGYHGGGSDGAKSGQDGFHSTMPLTLFLWCKRVVNAPDLPSTHSAISLTQSTRSRVDPQPVNTSEYSTMQPFVVFPVFPNSKHVSSHLPVHGINFQRSPHPNEWHLPQL